MSTLPPQLRCQEGIIHYRSYNFLDSGGDTDIRLFIGGCLDGNLLACFRPHRGYGLGSSGGVVDWSWLIYSDSFLQVMDGLSENASSSPNFLTVTLQPKDADPLGFFRYRLNLSRTGMFFNAYLSRSISNGPSSGTSPAHKLP